jgi:hypothetical protein
MKKNVAVWQPRDGSDSEIWWLENVTLCYIDQIEERTGNAAAK